MMQRSFKTARECAVLAHYSAAQAVIDGVANKPTPSDALMNDLWRLDRFEQSGGAVLWGVLMSLPPERFNIPATFPCGQRFIFSVSGSELIDDLRDLRDRLSAATPSVRPMYLNYVIRAVLRCGYALSHEKEFRDVLIVAGTDAEDNPTAFDPSIFDSPALVPSDTDRILNRAAMDVLYPNGIVDADGTAAEGYVDESDLL